MRGVQMMTHVIIVTNTTSTLGSRAQVNTMQSYIDTGQHIQLVQVAHVQTFLLLYPYGWKKHKNIVCACMVIMYNYMCWLILTLSHIYEA